MTLTYIIYQYRLTSTKYSRCGMDILHTTCILYLPLVQELEELQEKHSTRPDVFDDVEEEHAVDILTAEITQVMNGWMDGCNKLMDE